MRISRRSRRHPARSDRSAIVIVGVLVAGALVTAQRFSGDATARPAPSRPLYYAEVESWCASTCSPAFTDLPDGNGRVVLADLQGARAVLCQPMDIPDDVSG